MKEVNFRDRVPTNPGRIVLTPVTGQPNTFDMTRADNPTEEGTPIDKATYNSIILSRLTGRYYPCTATFSALSTTTITRNPVPITGWAVSNITKATNGTDYTIEASSSINSEYSVEKALDGKYDTQWGSLDGINHSFIIQMPVAIKIKKFKLQLGITGSTSGNTVTLQGSNNKSTWDTVHTITSYPFNAPTEYTVSTPGVYEYYRLYFTRPTSSRVYINEFEITDCEVSVYTANYVSNEMPAIWEIGQRVTIETTAAPKHSILANSFNGVNVTTVLQPLKRYELRYTGAEFVAKEV